jgi:hypothetical protein
MSKFRRTMIGSVAAAALVALVAAAAPASASTAQRSDENEGTTTVVLNPAVVGTLVSLGVAPVAPGTLTAPGGVYQLAFPITNDPTKGLVYHSGGLNFSNASGHDVRIVRFIVNTNSGFLTASTKVDGHWVGRVRIFKLGAVKRINGTVPSCDGIAAGLSLSQTAAAALGVPSAQGLFIGDACVVPGAEG